jgi:hypothetical protein
MSYTPSPFPVDPAILSRIRAMTARDTESVAALHKAAMGESLWAKLGSGFLEKLYTALVGHPDFLGFVYEDESLVQGFIAGTENGLRMMNEVRRDNFANLTAATLKGLATNPAAIFPLLQTPAYFSKSNLPGFEGVKAESMFCSFEKELRGKKISGLINKILFDELAARGHHHVKITSEANNEGAFRQLSTWGFEQIGAFRFYGKQMIAWRLDLINSPRVEPIRLADRKAN